MAVLRLSRDQARRIAVRAQLLDAPRPTDLLTMVDRLTLLQVDPTAVIAPSADLVAWSRLGPSYQPGQLRRALDVDRTLFEQNAMIRPMADVGLHLAESAPRGRSAGAREWLRRNDSFRRDVLDLLGTAGPRSSRDIPDTSVVPWTSTGWTHQRTVTQLLELLAMDGEVAIAGRAGKERLWDLAERVYPANVRVPAVAEARRIRNERRLRSLGIARARGTTMPIEPIDVGDAGEPAEVEGVTGEWRVDPVILETASGGGDLEGRAALLSPFDRLVYDRTRTVELFGFEYTLEMYKPAARRRWGYFALPVLYRDRLIGKVDAAADRKQSVLRVHAIHRDGSFTRDATRAVRSEMRALATWLGLDDLDVPA